MQTPQNKADDIPVSFISSNTNKAKAKMALSVNSAGEDLLSAINTSSTVVVTPTERGSDSTTVSSIQNNNSTTIPSNICSPEERRANLDVELHNEELHPTSTQDISPLESFDPQFIEDSCKDIYLEPLQHDFLSTSSTQTTSSENEIGKSNMVENTFMSRQREDQKQVDDEQVATEVASLSSTNCSDSLSTSSIQTTSCENEIGTEEKTTSTSTGRESSQDTNEIVSINSCAVELNESESLLVDTLMSRQRKDQQQVDDEQVATEVAKLPSTNYSRWTMLPPMPKKRTRFTSACVNGKIYVFGGVVGSAKSKDAVMFDPSTNMWHEIPSMKMKRSGSSCAVVGQKIYIIGGVVDCSYNSTNHCEVYDTTTQQWDTVSSMGAGRHLHSSVTVGNKIFVLGGYRCEGKGEVYDVITDTWSNISSMHFGRYGFGAVADGDTIYAIGGKVELVKGKNQGENEYFRYLETMEIYNIAEDKWELSNSKMKNRRCGCSAFLVGESNIVVMGGSDEKELVKAIEVYQIPDDKWKSSLIPPFEYGRSYFSAHYFGDDLIIFGGSANNSVEKITNVLIECDGNDNFVTPEENKFSNIDKSRKRKLSQSLVPNYTRSRVKKPCDIMKRVKREVIALDRPIIDSKRSLRSYRKDRELNNPSPVRKATFPSYKKVNPSPSKKGPSQTNEDETKKNKIIDLLPKRRVRPNRMIIKQGSNGKLCKGQIIEYIKKQKSWKVKFENGSIACINDIRKLREMIDLAIKHKVRYAKSQVQMTSNKSKKSMTDDASETDDNVVSKDDDSKMFSDHKDDLSEDSQQLTSESFLFDPTLNRVKHLIVEKKKGYTSTERDIFGKEQAGPLCSRKEKIQLHILSELEERVFGKPDTKGDYQVRAKRLEEFLQIKLD